jgi:hypothetical protein
VGAEKTRMPREMQTEGQAHKISGGNENSYGNWTNGHACYILTRSLSTFCLCSETLPEVGFKSNWAN